MSMACILNLQLRVEKGHYCLKRNSKSEWLFKFIVVSEKCSLESYLHTDQLSQLFAVRVHYYKHAQLLIRRFIEIQIDTYISSRI